MRKLSILVLLILAAAACASERTESDEPGDLETMTCIVTAPLGEDFVRTVINPRTTVMEFHPVRDGTACKILGTYFDDDFFGVPQDLYYVDCASYRAYIAQTMCKPEGGG